MSENSPRRRIAVGQSSTKTGTTLLKRVPVPSLVDQAYEAIVEAIVDRAFEPGTRLSIDGLAVQLDMSATPVREALARIASERLVTQDAMRGFAVAPLLTESEYHQLFEARQVLELHALQTGTIDAAVIAQLREILERMRLMHHGAAYRDFREFNQADREFHRNLVSLSHNQFLTRAWLDLHFHLHVGRLYTGSGVIDFSHALREHSAIVEALQHADRAAAIAAVSSHVGQAEARLRKLLPTR